VSGRLDPWAKGPQYPLDWKLGGSELIWAMWRKFLTLPGLKLSPSVVQSVANRYTACTILVRSKMLTLPESTHTPIQVSNIFEFQNINSVFHILQSFLFLRVLLFLYWKPFTEMHPRSQRITQYTITENISEWNKHFTENAAYHTARYLCDQHEKKSTKSATLKTLKSVWFYSSWTLWFTTFKLTA
jgi:hypothetical protein